MCPVAEQSANRSNGDHPGALGALRRSLAIERACVVLILALVAWLGTLEPSTWGPARGCTESYAKRPDRPDWDRIPGMSGLGRESGLAAFELRAKVSRCSFSRPHETASNVGHCLGAAPLGSYLCYQKSQTGYAENKRCKEHQRL